MAESAETDDLFDYSPRHGMEEELIHRAKDGEKAWKRQLLVTLGASTGGLSMGLCLGWVSPAIQQFQNVSSINSTKLSGGNITDSEADWIGAALPLGAILQVFITGILMDCLGRRLTVILSSLPMCIGWLCISLAGQLWQVYIGRILTGFSAGMYSALIPVYIGEIASPKLRGFLGTIFQGCVVLGILSMYSLGIFLSWDVLAFIAVLVPIFTLILAIFLLPDSPTWLISDGRIEFATEVTLWLRDRELVLHEIEELTETSLRADESPFPSPPSYCDASKTKPVSLIFLVMLINQLCGISVVETFFHGIFNWNDTVLPASLSSSIVGVCMLVSTLIAGPVVAKFNRKPLLAITLIVMSVSMLVLGVYVYLLPPRPFNSVPLVCLFLYVSAYSLGIGPLAWVLLADLALPKVAPAVVTISSLTNWGVAFALTCLYSPVIKIVGLSGLWFGFSLLSGAGSVLVILILPETKGLSATQILQLFK
ncbi:facilitated trehalose transporter Tret1 [Eurytemora carolleeae]|uniref:facilitated trehalose transporter Tret1 n=1 Tax=Eurytemora carolleeae TaxID=1294199 RepID=UPI000C7806EC|nr:facilitated trehalose transporter Tret1 [Eurytemora carolleeae]|eukprot:XP_023342031.1 facilitated trehalose transporter Tret1-like [Eurytemora affinis]